MHMSRPIFRREASGVYSILQALGHGQNDRYEDDTSDEQRGL